MKKAILVLAAIAVLLGFAACELFYPTILVSGHFYTSNYSSATLAQALCTDDIYVVVATSANETDLEGTFAELNTNISGILNYKAGQKEYQSILVTTSTGNDDYGPVEVTVPTDGYYRVLLVQDVDNNSTLDASDKIVGGQDTPGMNVYSSGEETGTDTVYFDWTLVDAS